MKTTAERLNYIRRELGLTFKDMSKHVEVGQDALRIAIKRGNIKPFYINIFSDKLGINKEWLLSGIGEIYKNEKFIKNINEPNDSLINLIEIEGKQAVSARGLYEFLGYDVSNWSSWVKKNIIENEFAIQSEDYYELVPNTRYIDFALHIDFAKKICMMARTEKGEQARSYFIECENKVKLFSNTNSTAVDFNDPDTILRLAQNWKEERQKNQILSEQNSLQEKQLKISAPKVEYFEKVLQSESTYTTTLIAKELGMSAAALNKILCDNKIQYKQNDTWVLYSKFQDKGFTKTRTSSFTDTEGKTRTNMLTVWTELGRKSIHEFIAKLNSKKISIT